MSRRACIIINITNGPLQLLSTLDQRTNYIIYHRPTATSSTHPKCVRFQKYTHQPHRRRRILSGVPCERCCCRWCGRLKAQTINGHLASACWRLSEQSVRVYVCVWPTWYGTCCRRRRCCRCRHIHILSPSGCCSCERGRVQHCSLHHYPHGHLGDSNSLFIRIYF